MTLIYYVESNVIRGQVIDSGASLARFVSSQAAVPVLSENWVPLELFVEDASERGAFDYLVVVDHDAVVRATTQQDEIGTPFVFPLSAESIVEQEDMLTFELELPDGMTIFLFDTPVLFQQTEIGRVYLGIDRADMDSVLRSTLLLLAGAGILTVMSVVGMLYMFGGLLARPIRLLSRFLHNFGAGDLDSRISDTRNDEIGQLFTAFNNMADQMQARSALSGPAETHDPELKPVEIDGDAETTLVTRPSTEDSPN